MRRRERVIAVSYVVDQSRQREDKDKDMVSMNNDGR